MKREGDNLVAPCNTSVIGSFAIYKERTQRIEVPIPNCLSTKEKDCMTDVCESLREREESEASDLYRSLCQACWKAPCHASSSRKKISVQVFWIVKRFLDPVLE